MVRFSEAVMLDGAKRMRTWLKSHDKLPAWLTMTGLDDNKTYELTPKQYAGLYENRNGYFKSHGRFPTRTTLVYESKNPLVWFHQPNIWTCCPTSVAMCSEYLYNTHSITECKVALGTVESGEVGTSPSQLINNIHKLGMVATRIPRTSEAVKKSLDAHHPIVAHIETGKATKPKCLGYIKNYGHYICIYDYSLNGRVYKVADPTKGLKPCSCDEINHATNGRDIGFYSISLA